MRSDNGASSSIRPDQARGRRWLWLAAILGGLHAAFSLYWAAGGTWLLATVGAWAALEAEASRLEAVAVLLGAGLVKLAAAVVPVLVEYGRMPGRRRVWRAISWAGGVFLILYGGVYTGGAIGLLAGWIRPVEDFDRAVILGHALLWDPLFFFWGCALVIHLALSRGQGRSRGAGVAVDDARP